MKMKANIVLASAALMFGSTAWSGEGNMGDHQWVCQVTTPSNVFGIVEVWSDTREEAVEVSVGARAWTTLETHEPAQNVVECVKLGEEMTRDKEFWTFFERTPR